MGFYLIKDLKLILYFDNITLLEYKELRYKIDSI